MEVEKTSKIVQRRGEEERNQLSCGFSKQSSCSEENSLVYEPHQNNHNIQDKEEQLACAVPFDNLFSQQRTYFESTEMKAIQNLRFKKDTNNEDIEFERISQVERTSKDPLQPKDESLKFSRDNSPLRLDTFSPKKSPRKYRNSIKYLSDPTTFDGHKILVLNSFDQDGGNTNQQSNQKLSNNYLEPDVFIGKLGGGQSKDMNQQDFLKAMKGIKNIFRFLGIIQPKLKRFYYTKTMSGKMRHLSLNVRNTINDLTDYEMRGESKSFFGKFLAIILNILGKLYTLSGFEKIPIFNPENKLKIIFNCVLLVYNIFYMYLRSLEIFFEAHFQPYESYFHYIAEAGWVIEMLMQMNTSMYYHNHFTKDRKIIMKIYLEEYFFFEILPLIFDGRTSDNLALSVLYKLPLLLKFKGMLIILKNTEFYILQILENHSFYFLLKLILQMMLFGHMLACGFSLILACQNKFLSADTQWQHLFLETEEEWNQRYLRSLYWAFTTMMNVFNLTPTSNIELLFTCCCMLISCVAFGYLLSSIGEIMSEINKKQKDYKQDLNILNQFMKRKKIEIGLVRRANIQLKKYYEQQTRVRYLQENETLMKLNEYMMKELMISSNYKIIKKFPFFFNLFTEQTLTKICVKMQERLYSPNQIIFDNSIQGQFSDYYLYLIVDGTIQIEDMFNLNANQEKKNDNKYLYLNDTKDSSFNDSFSQDEKFKEKFNENVSEGKKIGRKLSKGDYFGTKGFFSGSENIQKAISYDFSTLMVISKSDVEKILQEEKKDFEKFREVSDKIVLNEDYNDLKPQCHSCTSRYHATFQCPKVYYDKDRVYVIQKQNYSFFQDRKTYERLDHQSFHALLNADEIKNKAFNIRFEYGFDQLTDQYDNDSYSDQESFLEHEDIVEPLIRDRSANHIFREDNKWSSNDIVLEEHKQYIESHGISSKEMNHNDSNILIPHPDEETPDVLGKNRVNEQNLLLPAMNNFPFSPDLLSAQNLQNVPPSLRRGSVDGNAYNNLRNQGAIKQDQILKQLVEGMQSILNNLNYQKSSPLNGNIISNVQNNINNNISNNINNNILNPITGLVQNQINKRRTSNQIGGSALEMSTKGGNSIYQKSSYERKNTNQEEPQNSVSRKSILRSALRSNSMVSRRRQTTFVDSGGQEVNRQKQILVVQGELSSQMNVYSELDRMQDYEFYFPHQNAVEVIKRFNNALTKMLKKLKLKKMSRNSPLRKSYLISKKGDLKSQ